MDNRKRYCTIKFYSNFPINDYSNQVYYSKENEQLRDNTFDSYCTNTLGEDLYENIASPNKSVFSFRLETNFLNANKYNYGVIIENNKRYYFFVQNVSWSSNMVTATFNCVIDFWQTYCYEVEFKKSFVEREHVKYDTFGLHTLDEGLPISDYKCVQYKECINNEDILFCVSVSDNEYIYKDNIPQNKASMVVYTQDTQNYQSLTLGFISMQEATDFINFYVSKNKINSICGFYVAQVPSSSRFQVWVYDLSAPSSLITTCWQVFPNSTFSTKTMSLLSTVDGYNVKNNKCLCFPYNFVNITNNMGASLKIKYEYLSSGTDVVFNYNFPTQEGASCMGYVSNYLGIQYNLDASISGMTNIELPFITDTYSAYLSANINALHTNINNIERTYTTSAITGGVEALGSLLGGFSLANNKIYSGKHSADNQYNSQLGANVSSGQGILGYGANMLNMYTQTHNTVDMIDASLKDQQSKGDILHGSTNTSLMQILNKVGFRCEIMQIRREYIEIIDNYFEMFGYKVNVIKKPQFDSRPYWNYVKTSNLNIVGNIPIDAIETIKGMFNNGTTIWHRLSYMYNYDNNNH